MPEEKVMVNLVIAGHVDHGKSTLVGQLFYALGRIPERTMERFRRQAEAVGKGSFYLAFFTDRSLAERERGISVETAYVGLETETKRFNIIDAPGHRDFVKNMVTGTAEADAALLVVDAGGTAHGGLAPQTCEHLTILKALGITSLIVAVNKIDAVDYSKEIFEYCQLEVRDFLNAIKFPIDDDVPWIPTSALMADNVIEPSQRTPWYSGPTVLGAMEQLADPLRAYDLPLRMPILRTFTVPGVGAVVAGKIETGQVRPGQDVVIVPYPGSGRARAQVRSIEWQHQPVDVGRAGDDVGVMLTKQERGFVSRQIRKGAMMGEPDDPPTAVTRFKADLVVLAHPSGIRRMYAPYLHVHQAAMPCSVEEILDVTDSQGAPKTIEGEGKLVNGDSAVVWIRPHRPLVIEEFARFPKLGRFVLRDGGTVAAGTCVEVAVADKQ